MGIDVKRLEVLERIAEYEKAGRFNDDVEIDPPSKPSLPNEVDYVNKKLSSKFLTILANFLGKTFFESMIKKKTFVISSVKGLENIPKDKGVIITCNHFNIKDNYAVYRAIRPVLPRGHYLYKVIKEGNYNNFKGPVKLMMRHANTLPLSSNFDTMKKFYDGVETLLSRGEKILVYPEQAMWFNYRKPRPLKKGAFKIAARYSAPIVPAFICMKDGVGLDGDGFPVQEYHIEFFKPIYIDDTLPLKQAIKNACEKNYRVWVDAYENFYGEKLSYDIKQ